MWKKNEFGKTVANIDPRLMTLFSLAVLAVTVCGCANTYEDLKPNAIAPTFSLREGKYNEAQRVTISSASADSTIYYTTDGSTPTTFSRVYDGPVSITSTVELKAIAVGGTHSSSKMTKATYSIDAGGKSLSGLPVLSGSGVQKPAGVPGKLVVLNWAGSHAALTYSFDDSLPSQIAHYPDLRATGVRMTFFLICRDPYSQVWAQAAKDGFELGNHTEHHCFADGTDCRDWSGSIQKEYDECTKEIKARYGVDNVWTTSAPHGDKRYQPVAVTRFFLNRSTRGGLMAPNDETDPMGLVTHVLSTGETARAMNSRIDLAYSSRKWLIITAHSLGGDGYYAPVNFADLLASINHGKSLGGLWMDSMVNVGAYWEGQKALSKATRSTHKDVLEISWTLPSHFPSGKFVRVSLSGGTLKQNGEEIPWNNEGYYEVALDPGSLTIEP